MDQIIFRLSDFESAIMQQFREMFESQAFVDVTIGCERSSLKAHKMVLAASSPYFQSLFLDHPNKHPIVILKDIRFEDLKTLVEFMYRGEVNVSQGQFQSLIKAAETLQINRLTDAVQRTSVLTSDAPSVTPSLITYSKKKRKRPKADPRPNVNAESAVSGDSDAETSEIQSKAEMYVLETDSGQHVLTTNPTGDESVVQSGTEIQLVEGRVDGSSRILELSMADVVAEQMEPTDSTVNEMETSTEMKYENDECGVTIDGPVDGHLNLINVGNLFTSPGGSSSHAIVLLKKKQSFVWEFFSETGKGSVKCRKCNKLLAYKDSSGSTSNMIKHLKTVHNVERVSKPPLQE